MARRGRPRIELMGQRFERLMVLAIAPERQSGATMWICHCDCGRETIVRAGNLRNGNTKSCGQCGYYQKRQPTEERKRALTYSAQRLQIIDRIEAARDRTDELRVAAYPNLMDNVKIVTTITHAKAFIETSYRDLLWDSFELANRNLDLAEGCIRELEGIMGDGDAQQHERTPLTAMVGINE